MKLCEVIQKETLTEQEKIFLLKQYKSVNIYFIKLFLRLHIQNNYCPKNRTRYFNRDLKLLEGKAKYQTLDTISPLFNKKDRKLMFHVLKDFLLDKKSKEQSIDNKLNDEMELFLYFRTLENIILVMFKSFKNLDKKNFNYFDCRENCLRKVFDLDSEELLEQFLLIEQCEMKNLK